METAIEASLPQIHNVESGPAVIFNVRNPLWYSRHAARSAGEVKVKLKAKNSTENKIRLTFGFAPINARGYWQYYTGKIGQNCDISTGLVMGIRRSFVYEAQLQRSAFVDAIILVLTGGEQIGGNSVEIWVGSFAALAHGKLGDGSTQCDNRFRWGYFRPLFFPKQPIQM